MKEFKPFVATLSKDWTLFLDRDGVINKRLPDEYVKIPTEFEFFEGVIESICILSGIFNRILVVTNQQGIGKKLMTEEELANVHNQMITTILLAGGRIDKVYFCPDLASDSENCRKPNSFMARQAQQDFPEIDFTKSVMIGDSSTDIEFGFRLGMTTVFVGKTEIPSHTDFVFSALEVFAQCIKNAYDLLHRKGRIC